MPADNEPLWPAGVVPLVGADGEEDREHLEAWCRRFAEECEASAAGSDLEDSEAFLHPTHSNRLLVINSEGEAKILRSCADQWRAKAIGAGVGTMTVVVLVAWLLLRGSTGGSDILTFNEVSHGSHEQEMQGRIQASEAMKQRESWESIYRYMHPTRTVDSTNNASDWSTPLTTATTPTTTPTTPTTTPTTPTTTKGPTARPSVTPPVASYANNYVSNNPLRIPVYPQRSQNYFIIIGDWGKAGGPGTCQFAVAGKLKSFVENQKKAGKNLLFIASVGDNFYWTGVTPEAWHEDWEVPYGPNDPNSPLFQIPWLAIYGNHDFGEHDPYAFCPHVFPNTFVGSQAYSGSQLNKERNPKRPDSTRSFWMPDYNYHYEIPEANVEVIALDTNAKIDPNQIAGNAKARGLADALCGGRDVSQNFLEALAKAGEALVLERAKLSTATTILMIQHYPGWCPRALFENALPPERRGKVRLICAYGHVHDQKCVVKGPQGCMDVLSGGGGGCCGPKVNLAGFTAVHLDDAGGAWVDVESPAVRMEKDTCSW
ncbi:unnamed protein product [Durusdinium trenchii]|uniref:Calcineurin-like phosphoesterase domain-containing protein n=1 Tax=Durusdinium trenchii TaxID=1381693 RepID=A0ABP0NIU9_9DINO